MTPVTIKTNISFSNVNTNKYTSITNKITQHFILVNHNIKYQGWRECHWWQVSTFTFQNLTYIFGEWFRLPIILDDIQTRKINICRTVPTYHKDLGPGFGGKKSSEDAVNWKEEDEQHGQTKNRLENMLWKKSLKTAHCRTLNTTNMSGCWSKQYNGLQALNESTGIEADENFLYILYHTIWAHNDSQNFNTSILVFLIYETGTLVFHDKWLL